MSTPNSNDRTMLDFFSAVPKPKQKLSENKNKKKRKTIIESSDSSYDSTSDTCNNDDERFNQLGLLAWYDDELLDIINWNLLATIIFRKNQTTGRKCSVNHSLQVTLNINILTNTIHILN